MSPCKFFIPVLFWKTKEGNSCSRLKLKAGPAGTQQCSCNVLSAAAIGVPHVLSTPLSEDPLALVHVRTVSTTGTGKTPWDTCTRNSLRARHHRHPVHRLQQQQQQRVGGVGLGVGEFWPLLPSSVPFMMDTQSSPTRKGDALNTSFTCTGEMSSPSGMGGQGLLGSRLPRPPTPQKFRASLVIRGPVQRHGILQMAVWERGGYIRPKCYPGQEEG